jgi:hypothetical protein
MPAEFAELAEPAGGDAEPQPSLREAVDANPGRWSPPTLAVARMMVAPMLLTEWCSVLDYVESSLLAAGVRLR